MSFFAWINGKRNGHNQPKKPFRTSKFLPRLEELEDRVTPSVLTVTNTNDSGHGSLRDAIQSSHKGGIIKFDSSLSGQTIILNSELSITHNVKIQGLGSGNLTIDGNGQFRIFDISGASNVSLVG